MVEIEFLKNKVNIDFLLVAMLRSIVIRLFRMLTKMLLMSFKKMQSFILVNAC